MKRLFKILMVIAIAFVLVAPAQAEWRDMWAAVYKLDNSGGGERLTRITSGITFQVLQRNSDTEETLYVMQDKNKLTSLTNPVSAANYASNSVCNDVVSFRVDPGESGDTYVDIVVVDTNGGFTAFVDDFDVYTHRIIIDQRASVQHHGMIWYSNPHSSEVDTGLDFLYDTNIAAMWIEVTTATNAGTLDVGLLSSETLGNADGFLDGVSIAALGHPVVTLTTSGASMDDGTNFDPMGATIVATNAVSLTYTSNTTAGAGYINWLFTRTR